MKPIVRPLLAALLLALALPALAADRKAPKSDAPPPPGIHDPVSGEPAAPPAAPPADAAAGNGTDPLAPLPKPDARLVRDKASRDAAANSERIAASDVTTRKQGDDTVQEYRQNGRLWMIRIVHPDGSPQTFTASDPGGRLLSDPQQGPISPVYYSLYEWK